MSTDWKERKAKDRGNGDDPASAGPQVDPFVSSRLLDAARQAVIATDAQRRIVFWNKAAESLYGWTADEVLGLDILEVTPLDPEAAKRVLEPVERGGSWAGEYRLRRKSGELFSAFVTISPLHDQLGQPAGVLGLSFDISDDRAERREHVTRASQVATSVRSPSEPGLRARLFSRRASLPAQVGVALGLVALATLARMGLGLVDPRIAPFTLYFPAILLAAVVGGWRAGAVATGASVALAWALFVEPRVGLTAPSSTAVINMALYGGAAAAIVALAGYVGALVDRLAQSEDALADRNLHYDTLFESMSEGFALCEAIRDDEGSLADYVILEMNPALQRMLGVGPEAVGGKFSRTPGDNSAWLALCDRVLKTGVSAVFEYHNRATGLWHEIHINRVTQTRMAQLFFDVTERKAAQARQGELYDELNHRVNNNLTIVSSILSMQARSADPAVRVELTKAVDRVQSIAEVHQILHEGNHTGEVDFGAYLESLCERLSKSLLADDRVRILVDAQSAPMSADQVVRLGVVVNELVTNAVKYAYPPPERGVISVRFHATQGGALLAIGDSGRGLSEASEGKIGGLGLRLLHSLVQQVGGKLEIRRHPGATFEISLPSAVDHPE